MSIELTASIDEDELHSAGWHHEDECDVECDCPTVDDLDDGSAQVPQRHVEVMHALLHPQESLSSRRCHQEPCRSLHDEFYGEWLA